MSIRLLRECIKSGKTIAFPEGQDISTAKVLILDGQEVSLDEETGFVSGDKINHVLRTVYQCWLHRDSNTTEYISDCEGKNIPVVSFLERTELISYLNGSSETCAYLQGAGPKAQTGGEKRKSTEEQGAAKKKREIDPFLREVLNNERNLIDHNRALQGTKPVDFSSVAKECEYKIIRAAKQKTKAKGKVPEKSTASAGKNKEPIIILSPSASAILNMSNVKEFLQDGRFTNTADAGHSTSNMLQIVRNSKRFDRRLKFLVVSNVEKFFTKPEYWDRVVAVFTTGQEWQFKNYKYNQPSLLFQKVKGFYLYYNGDPIPDKIQQWNVQPIGIERTQRFKDRQTSEFLWESLERFMAAKGYR
ncbi:hypothetical protein KL930_001495 [Ogataea haglerorum]|nr:hypothetical protein KL951_001981 [Ogataea haglerorum]KAG7765174.1 hypothetical protein KL931_004478 [Ogataea haglerorum]KAG7780570.1 hypothetical protein KL922_000921 [Ogataea haglerorum]KAG7781999.1 hypothetical protein KL930_001495 [Ogataea haglerorum]